MINDHHQFTGFFYLQHSAERCRNNPDLLCTEDIFHVIDSAVELTSLNRLRNEAKKPQTLDFNVHILYVSREKEKTETHYREHDLREKNVFPMHSSPC